MAEPVPFGKYLLLEEIAKGGMAVVYKALYRTEGTFEKTLVIKRILPRLASDEDFVSRFRDEARVSVGLSHANLVQVFDFGQVDGDFFLAMELVEGQNLRGILVKCAQLGRTLPVSAALVVASESAKGLAYAHGRRDDQGRELGIVHRDISPSNLLVSYEGEVKITDFGIAKAASRSTETQDGTVRGKVRYMSPEQALGEKVDGRADVFSLGSVLWECITGRTLLDGESDLAVLGKIVRGLPFSKPSEFVPDIDPEIERVVMAAVERDATKRLSAAEFYRELGKLLGRTGYSSMDLAVLMKELFRDEIEGRLSPLHPDAATGPAPGTKQLAAKPPSRPDPTLHVPLEGGRDIDRLEAGTAVSPGRPPSALPRRRWLPLAVLALAVPLGGLLVNAAFDPLKSIPSPTPVVFATTTTEPAPTVVAIASIATPIATASRRPVRTPTPKVSGKGLIGLISEPYGDIFIDGVSTGRQTPAFDAGAVEIAAGDHEIKIVNPATKQKKIFRVKIVAGELRKWPPVKLE